jgi:hypothetical protein
VFTKQVDPPSGQAIDASGSRSTDSLIVCSILSSRSHILVIRRHSHLDRL